MAIRLNLSMFPHFALVLWTSFLACRLLFSFTSRRWWSMGTEDIFRRCLGAGVGLRRWGRPIRPTFLVLTSEEFSSTPRADCRSSLVRTSKDCNHGYQTRRLLSLLRGCQLVQR